MNRKREKRPSFFCSPSFAPSSCSASAGHEKPSTKQSPTRVCEDNRTTYAPSSITISGTLKKAWSSTSFVGTFAMESYEPSCRDGAEAKINWVDNEYPILTFFYAGDFSPLDVESIDIDKDIDRMMVTLNDGTIIASENYFVPTEAMNGN